MVCMVTTKNKVLVFGSLAFDYIMRFNENIVNAVSMNVNKGEFQGTITASSRTQFFGGTAGNIAYNLGLLGVVKATVFGAVGKDFESLGYSKHLSQFKNIELGIDVYPDLFTAACYIVNDVKANQMIIFHGGALDKSKEIDLKKKVKDPQNYGYAINSTQSVDAMMSFSAQLHDLKIPTIFDPGQVTPLFSKENLMQAIQRSEIIIGNNHEIGQIESKTSLSEEELLKSLKAIIITKGAEGSELILKEEGKTTTRISIPICKPNKVVDPTGAGDGYRGGLLSGLALNLSLVDSCRLGSVIGSFVVETYGGQSHKCNFSDISNRYSKSFGKIPTGLKLDSK